MVKYQVICKDHSQKDSPKTIRAFCDDINEAYGEVNISRRNCNSIFLEYYVEEVENTNNLIAQQTITNQTLNDPNSIYNNCDLIGCNISDGNFNSCYFDKSNISSGQFDLCVMKNCHIELIDNGKFNSITNCTLDSPIYITNPITPISQQEADQRKI